MIIELRKKSQITIPKEIINELNLQEKDQLPLHGAAPALVRRVRIQVGSHVGGTRPLYGWRNQSIR